MNNYEKFILKHRTKCEFPTANGSGMCDKPATNFVAIRSPAGKHYMAAVCHECFTYAEKEKRDEKQRQEW
jgi:hypothetical protein